MLTALVLPLLVAWPAGVILALALVAYMAGAGGQAPKRAEVPGNVDGLRTAQLAYDAAFDTFVPCGLYPRGLDELGEGSVPWTPAEAPGGYWTVGWAAEGPVRGTYQVLTVTREGDPFPGMDFVVHGWSDVDGDGELAHYTATRSTGTVRLTPDDVY